MPWLYSPQNKRVSLRLLPRDIDMSKFKSATQSPEGSPIDAGSPKK